MKNPSISFQSRRALPSLIQYSAALGLIVAGSTAQATDFYKANNTTNLNIATSATVFSWENLAGAPVIDPPGPKPVNGTGSTDFLIWDSRVTAANTVNMGDNIGVNTMRILSPGGPVTINGTQTFTFTNNGGVDMSLATQDLTLGAGTFFRATAGTGVTITQNVAINRVLTINSTVNVRNNATGGIFNHTGAGKTIYNGTFAPTNVTVSAGEVQFNAAAGSTRLGTSTTVISGGKLVVNNTSGSATGSGTVTVNNTGTVSGPGSMSGVVTVNSGGTISPGTGLGTLKAGSLTLAAGSKILWEGDPTPLALTHDLVDITGSDTFAINGGSIELYNVGTSNAFTGTGTFNIFKYNGSIPNIGNLSVDESSKVPDRSYIFGVSGGFVTLAIGVDNRPKAFWNIDAAGNWATATNWTGATVPNAISFVANLGGAPGVTITAPRTVTNNAYHTLGTLNIDSAQPFTLAGSGILNFDEGESAGTLHVENGSHLISAPINVPTEGILATIKNASSTLTVQSEIQGTGGVSKSGPGTLILSGDSYYFGTTSNGGGVLQLGAGGASGSVSGPISNGGILRVNRSDNYSFIYPISGTGSLDFTGSGTTFLAVANTFSGPTTISAGAIEIVDGQALQNSTLNLLTTGGPFQVSEFSTSVTFGALSGDRPFPLTNFIGIPFDLTVGQNNATTSYTASTTGSGGAFTKSGTGAFTLTGSHVFTGNATINAGTLNLNTGADFTAAAVNFGAGTSVGTSKLFINGGAIHSSASSLVTNASLGIEIVAGSANFDGGLTSDNNSDYGAFNVRATGGTLSAASMVYGRGNLNLGTTEPTAGSATAGLYINGGAVSISGALGIGKNATNSSASARMDSGSLTVGGATTVAINSTDRWSVLDIAGGTFISTDGVVGVRLGGTTNGQTLMLVRGASTVATAERFQFGQPDLSGSAILNQSAGSLYVGAGGMVLGSASPTLTARLKLGGGVLGATADSSSNVRVSLTGAAVVTGADALDVPHTVTFSGIVDGTGTLTKNGSGSVSFTSQANSFTGAVAVNTGTLGLGGQSGAVTVASIASLTPVGTLNTQAASTINGTLAIRYDADNLLEPGHVHSRGTLTLGAGSTLNIDGTGTLTGPVYFLASGATGISGAFGTISGAVPSGYTLNTSFNNGSGFPIIALVSNTASPFDLWAAGFGLSGAAAGATADPDNDGVRNLIEYGLGTNPTQFSAGPVLGQSGNFLTLTFNHIAGGGITFVIEANDSLDDTWDVVQTYPTFGSAGTTIFTDNVAVGTGNSRFIRLGVIKN